VRNFSQVIRRLVATAATTAASILIALLVLETGVRIWDGAPLTSIYNFVARELNSQVNRSNPLAQYDEQVGWVQTPNYSAGTVTTGEYGARMIGGEAVALRAGAVLVVGDSFAAGAGVPGADSWPGQLEHMIGTQVINAGVGGYGLDQTVLRAEQLLPVLKPRVLLVQSRLEFGLSLARMSAYAGAPKPYFVIQDQKLVRKNYPVPRSNATREDIGWLRSILGYSYLVQYVMGRLDLLQWWVSPTLAVNKIVLSNDEAVAVSCRLMRRLAELRGHANLRIALVFQYSGPEAIDRTLAWEPDHARVVTCAEREGLDVVDALDALRAAYRAGDAVSYQSLWQMQDHDRVYGHMTGKGNRLIANLVFERLFSNRSDAGAVAPHEPEREIAPAPIDTLYRK
jgi:hypothetical protein